MRKIFTLLLLSGLIMSCNAKTSDNESKSTSANAITFESKSYYASSEKGAAANIVIPVAQGESDAAKAINNRLLEEARGIIGASTETADYNTVVNSFIAGYEDFAKDQPSCSVGWEATMEGEIVTQTTEFINARVSGYVFAGGAHGNSSMISLLFDANTGKELSLSDLIKDIPAFTKLAETKFRAEHEIADDEPITTNGFWFENDTYALPGNIFFTTEGVELYYNHYEIAPYAAGPQVIKISMEEIKDLLSIKL